MYVWYLSEFLLMIAEEDVVNKLVKTRRLIQEQDIEQFSSAIMSKNSGKYQTYMYIDLLIDVDNVVRFVIVRFGTLAAILSNR
jgi:hypothetical protein